ncbi:hypothetical protein PQR27_25190 [Paraburkholderia fungorum]
MTFKALLAKMSHDAISTRIIQMDERELMPGDLTIAVEYSTVNFKDALAISGDCVGHRTLANVLAQTQYRGVVAACGLAQGPSLPGSVLPFIRRNVSLAGIDSLIIQRGPSPPYTLRAASHARLQRFHSG